MLKPILLVGCAWLTLSAIALAQDAATPDCAPNETACLRLPVVDVLGWHGIVDDDATESLIVLDADTLSRRDAPYLADQLRAVPGLGVSRSGAVGGLTQVRIRGAEANHTLLLIDGIEVSDPVTGESDFGLFAGFDPTRIEVLRGEQSALYGSDAIGGVINIVTDKTPDTDARIEAGSFSSHRLSGTLGLNLNATDLALSLADSGTDGIDTSGLGGEKDGARTTSALATAQHSFSDDWQATGLLRYTRASVDIDADTDFDGRLNNVDRVSDSDQWTLGAKLTGPAFGLDHLVRLSYNQVDRENLADGAYTDDTKGKRTKLAYSPSKTLQTDALKLTLSGLIDYETEDYQRRATDTAFGDPNQSQSFDTLGLAADARAVIGALTLSGSLRRDDNDNRFDDTVTGRIGAAYRIAGSNTVLRASTGRGIKNPTFTELFGFTPATFIGNPDLQPEQSDSWELGLQQGFGPLTLDLTYFDAALENEIFTDFIFTPGTNGGFGTFFATPKNRTGESERRGVELAGTLTLSESLSLSGAWTSIDSQNESGVDEIRVPETTASFGLGWRSLTRDGLKAGLALDYVGEQKDIDFGSFQTVTLAPYTLASATLDYPLTPRLTLTLRGENLLDETATDVFGYSNTGSGLFIGLKLR